MPRSPLCFPARMLSTLAVALLLAGLAPAHAFAQSTIDAGSPADTLSPAHPTVTVPVTLTRPDTTHMVGFSVSFTLAGGLALANGTASITLGGFLAASGATGHLQVLDFGGGHYRADGVTLGDPCGSAATAGTLFSVEVASAAGGGTGTLTIDSVKVRDCDNATLASIIGTASSVTIDNTPPTLSLATPDGGESWVAASAHDITWSASDTAGVAVDGIDLYVATDGGTVWTAIATGLANSGTYSWTVPNEHTTTARVLVIARDALGNVARDSSAAVFTIVGTTVTGVASSANPSVHGQSVSFTATVTPATAGGTVQFQLDGADFGAPVALTAGTATSGAIATLFVGTHVVTAAYAGDASHSASADTLDGGQVVNRAATLTVLGSAANPSVLADSVTLTATVTAVAPGAGAPADTVAFYDGLTLLGDAPLDSAGTAVLVTAAIPAGPRALHAEYAGDSLFDGSVSADHAHEVKVRIIASAGPNGAIAPPDTTLHSAGTMPAFTFTPDSAYHVSSVLVDSVAQALTSPYTFAPLSANHTIAVAFELNPPVAALSTLAASPLKSGNDGSGRTRVSLTWTAPPAGSTVAVYRAPYGNYPEYDDGPSAGSVPSAPSYPPTAPWVLTAVSAPGETDLPPARDFYYYCAFVTDTYGTHSPVSNLTTGTLSYALGDVTDGTTPGQGDDQVGTADLSLLGSVYGRVLTLDDTYNYLDVGPTTDYSLNARPFTDDLLDFEDLVMLALHYGRISAPLAAAMPAPAAADALTLLAPERVTPGEDVRVPLQASGTGAMRALAVKLAWDPAVVTPVGVSAGTFLTGQGAVGMSAKPGTFDAAVIGRGLTGEGEAATFRFRVLAEGAPAIRFVSADARDDANRRLPVALAIDPVARPAVPVATRLAPASPMPFQDRTVLAFSIAQAGDAELAVFSVDGRRVRTLAHGHHDVGEYRVEWDGRGTDGRAVSAGAYYARLTTPHLQATRKLLRVR